MLLRVIARIIEIFLCFDVFVDIIRFNLKKKAVGVCVQKFALWAIFFFQLVVEKIVHEDLAVVKDRHTGVDRFVQNQLAFAHADSK